MGKKQRTEIGGPLGPAPSCPAVDAYQRLLAITIIYNRSLAAQRHFIQGKADFPSPDLVKGQTKISLLRSNFYPGVQPGPLENEFRIVKGTKARRLFVEGADLAYPHLVSGQLEEQEAISAVLAEVLYDNTYRDWVRCILKTLLGLTDTYHPGNWSARGKPIPEIKECLFRLANDALDERAKTARALLERVYNIDWTQHPVMLGVLGETVASDRNSIRESFSRFLGPDQDMFLPTGLTSANRSSYYNFLQRVFTMDRVPFSQRPVDGIDTGRAAREQRNRGTNQTTLLVDIPSRPGAPIGVSRTILWFICSDFLGLPIAAKTNEDLFGTSLTTGSLQWTSASAELRNVGFIRLPTPFRYMEAPEGDDYSQPTRYTTDLLTKAARENTAKNFDIILEKNPFLPLNPDGSVIVDDRFLHFGPATREALIYFTHVLPAVTTLKKARAEKEKGEEIDDLFEEALEQKLDLTLAKAPLDFTLQAVHPWFEAGIYNLETPEAQEQAEREREVQRQVPEGDVPPIDPDELRSVRLYMKVPFSRHFVDNVLTQAPLQILQRFIPDLLPGRTPAVSLLAIVHDRRRRAMERQNLPGVAAGPVQ